MGLRGFGSAGCATKLGRGEKEIKKEEGKKSFTHEGGGGGRRLRRRPQLMEASVSRWSKCTAYPSSTEARRPAALSRMRLAPAPAGIDLVCRLLPWLAMTAAVETSGSAARTTFQRSLGNQPLSQIPGMQAGYEDMTTC